MILAISNGYPTSYLLHFSLVALIPSSHQVGSPGDSPVTFESVIFVCGVQSPQSGKLYSLSASVTGQLTTDTFKVGNDSRGISVLSES